MWYIYTMCTTSKNNEFMKFLNKWMELENILSKVTQSEKNSHSKWRLAQKLRISKIQFTDYMNLKNKKDQSVGALVLLILLEGEHSTLRRKYRDKVWHRD